MSLFTISERIKKVHKDIIEKQSKNHYQEDISHSKKKVQQDNSKNGFPIIVEREVELFKKQ